jgi:hypothetical protein
VGKRRPPPKSPPHTRPFCDARPIPVPGLETVPRATRMLRKGERCPSFEGHSLSPRAKPESSDSHQRNSLKGGRSPSARSGKIGSGCDTSGWCGLRAYGVIGNVGGALGVAASVSAVRAVSLSFPPAAEAVGLPAAPCTWTGQGRRVRVKKRHGANGESTTSGSSRLQCERLSFQPDQVPPTLV